LSRKNIWDPAEHLVLVPNHRKSQIIEYTHIIAVKVLKTYWNTTIMRFPFFCYWETPGWSQENLWHISNYLSRKNIRDPASNFVLVPNHQKSEIIEYTHIIAVKVLKPCWNATILGFSFFCYERHPDDLKKTFNKSQIICRGKISEIPQSTSCQNQIIRSPKII